MVTVHAGRDGGYLEILVHNQHFCWNSGYFRSLAVGQPVSLPNISARYFKTYTYWAYTSRLDYTALGKPSEDFLRWQDILGGGYNGKCRDADDKSANIEMEMQKSSNYAYRLIRFWCHAEFLQDSTLQNTIMDELYRWWITKGCVVMIDSRALELVDKHTHRLEGSSPKGHPLRQLCSDWAIFNGAKTIKKRLDLGKLRKEELPKWLQWEEPSLRYHVS